MSAHQQAGSAPVGPSTPYDTDAADFRSSVKRHYGTVLKRFAKRFAVFLPLWLLVFITGSDYAVPVSILGFLGLLISALRLWAHLSWLRRCSKVFREYPLEYRSQFVKLGTGRGRVLTFRLAEEQSGAPVMSGVNLFHSGWPTDIEDGFWFAGDELFGGIAFLPHTGELLFMQPQEWILMREQRANADSERVMRAKCAGIKGYVSLTR
jgi:hypothetical protein